jgi:hypothetical protein
MIISQSASLDRATLRKGNKSAGAGRDRSQRTQSPHRPSTRGWSWIVVYSPPHAWTHNRALTAR